MMHTEPPVVLCSRSGVMEFVRAGRWLGSRGTLVLDLPGVDKQEQTRAQNRFNHWRTVCGCQIGALALIVTLVWGLLADKQRWSVNAFVRHIAVAFAIAMIGKIVAIASARVILLFDMLTFAHRAATLAPDAMRR